jgi:hypothetical protein
MDAPDQQDLAPPPRPAKPHNVDFQLDFDALTITYRWRTVKHFILLFVCIVWDAVSVFLCSGISLDSFNALALVSTVFTLLGLGLTYYVLAGFLNRTVITVNLQWLIITHGPLPWCTDKRIEITRINQLYAEDTSSRFGYRLNAILRDNTKLNLLSGLSSPDIARFVEQSVEEYLHIEDRPVAGEIQKY